MGRSLKIGTAFGIGIYVHWTFLLLLGLVAYLNRSGGPEGSLFAAVFVLGVFGCVLLHELGHALTARYYGIATRDITMLPIGGVARLERMSEKPWEELCIAVAGPAVNVVIGACLLLVMMLILRVPPAGMEALVPTTSAEIGEKAAEYGFLPMFLVMLLLANVSLVVFNLIPAFPMDGGRVLRAMLSAVVGHLRATEAAAVIGMVFAGLICLYGLWVLQQSYNPLTIVLGMFVLFAGQQELLAVRYREAARRAALIDGQPVYPALSEPLPPLVRPVYPSLSSPEPNFSGFSWDRRLGAWIEWREGRAVAINGIKGEWGTANEESRQPG